MIQSDLSPGDVVFDVDAPTVLGIVTKSTTRSVTLEHGGRWGGPGLVGELRRREPRVTLRVPLVALGARWWNRSQPVRAALRRAGIER
jgi:hypothetical protein